MDIAQGSQNGADPLSRYARCKKILTGRARGGLSGYIVFNWYTKNGATYCCATLKWDRGKVRRALGGVDPLSPVPILDVSIRACGALDLEGLQHLIVADKSMRRFIE